MNKEYILKENVDFNRIIKNGSLYKYKEFIIYYELHKNKHYKFGISVGKKIGNAVKRNKIKRQIRSIISKNEYNFGFNCIIIVNKSINNSNYFLMNQHLNYILNHLNLIKGEKK